MQTAAADHWRRRIARLVGCIAAVTIVGCSDAAASDFPWLDTFDPDDPTDAGASLMSLAEGLHALEQDTQNTSLIVGAHGYASRGYEWIYPLTRLDDDQTATHFFRWNYEGCPAPAARTLADALRKQVEDNPAIEHIRVLGHSYGGVLVTVLAATWVGPVPLEIHAIAAPLAGTGGSSRCEYAPPSVLPDKVQLFQWRTRHELDGAFKDLDIDPQVVDIPGSQATRLPETYRNRRLGHNWSISWVADELYTKTRDTP